MRKPFTGKHMAATMVGGFGIVIAVNLFMASLAVQGFGGLVVKNSYIASQKYNDWLERARKSEALGYEAELERRSDGRLVLITRGVPEHADASATLRRPGGTPEDLAVNLERDRSSVFLSDSAVPQGRWIVRVRINSRSGAWAKEFPIG